MKNVGYFDVHLYGADPVKGISVESILKDNADPMTTVYLCGDIVDQKNAKKKLVKEANEKFLLLRNTLGERYRSGNHEVNHDEDIPLLVQGWGLCHSDMIFNGAVESRADRLVTPGAGMFSRFIKGLGSNARDYGIYSLHANFDAPDFQKRFIDYCETYKIEKGIIGGHKHPLEKVVKQIGKYTLVIYPRGRHELVELK